MLLSALDRAIVAHLQRDGRTSYRTIATHLDVTETTVQRRTQQLIEAGYFKIVGVLDPLRLGQGHAVIVGVSGELRALDDIAHALADLPDTRFVVSATGTFDVVCEVVTFERASLTRVLTDTLSRIAGIRTINTSWVMRTHKTTFLWGEEGEAGPENDTIVAANFGDDRVSATAGNGHAPDAAERHIIALLQSNGRMAYAEIAARLGTTESTARRHTLRLLGSGYFRVVAVSNPFRLGFEEAVLMWIKVDLSQVRAVMDALAGHPAIRYLSRTAGFVDIVAEGVFHDRAELAAFLDGALAAIEGVREVSISFELTLYKRGYARFADNTDHVHETTHKINENE